MTAYTCMGMEKMAFQKKQEVMSSLIFLTKNCDVCIKSCACVNGKVKSRHLGYKKENSSLPMVSNNGIFITGVIEVHKGRVVACFGIPGTFLYA